MLNFGGGQWAGLVASVAHMPDASACLAPSLQNGREQKESADCIDPPSWAVATDKPQEHTIWYVQDVAHGWNKNMATTHQNTNQILKMQI
jgi:hypothetical protein